MSQAQAFDILAIYFYQSISFCNGRTICWGAFVDSFDVDINIAISRVCSIEFFSEKNSNLVWAAMQVTYLKHIF